MSNAATLAAIARLRRSQPRNADTMLVCEELEKRLVTARNHADGNVTKPKRDRAAYMREYRKRKG